MVELQNHTQAGKLQGYLDHFDTLLNKIKLADGYAVSLFLGTLKPEIGHPVCMFKPKILKDAYALAKLQEPTYEALNGDASSYRVAQFPQNKGVGQTLKFTPSYGKREVDLCARGLASKTD